MKTLLLIIAILQPQDSVYSRPPNSYVESIIRHFESDTALNQTDYYLLEHTYDLHPDNFDMATYFLASGDTSKANLYYGRIPDSYSHEMKNDYSIDIPEEYRKRNIETRKKGTISQMRKIGDKSMVKISLHESQWRIMCGLFVLNSQGRIEFYRKYEQVE